jgi:hypothetical protein
MSMIAPKLGYFPSGVTAGVQIKTGPSGFFGVVSTITGGAVTVYDGTSTGGTIIFAKTLGAGEYATLGGLGIAAKNGLFLVVAAGSVVVLYT